MGADEGAVTVVYVPAGGGCFRREVPLRAGMCVVDAIRASGLQRQHPGAPWRQPGHVGIFGRAADLEQPLAPGDRVEICRALTLSPMQARRARAARGAR